MKRIKWNHTALLAVSVIGMFGATTVLAEGETGTRVTDKKIVPIQMLGVNDFHGALDTTGTFYVDGMDPVRGVGRASNLATHLNIAENEFKVNNESSVTERIQAGDLVGASPANSALLRDEPTMRVFNEMNFGIGTLGNHEFDKGLKEFVRIYEGRTPTKEELGPTVDDDLWNVIKDYPREASTQDILISNIRNKTAGEHGAVGDIPYGLQPYTIKEYGDGEDSVKVGYIGVVTREFPNLVLAQHTQEFEVIQESEAIAQYTKELREQGVHAIVVVSHVAATSSGGQAMGDVVEMMSEVEQLDPEHEVDVVFAGHNHQHTNGTIEREDKKDILVVQSTSQGKGYIDLRGELDVETQDFIATPEAKVLPTTDMGDQADAAVQGIVDDASEKIKPITNAAVATADLDKVEKDDKGNAFISRQTNEHNESALGNLITDGQLYMAHQSGLTDSNGDPVKVDFAITNNGGIRADLGVNPETGAITWGAAQQVQPFGNILQVISLSGADIKGALNEQYNSGKSGYFLQVAGLSYTYSGNAVDGTFKVEEVKDAKGNLVKDDVFYNVIINDFLFGGGDGFASFTNGQLVAAMDTDTETFVNYFKEINKQGEKVVSPEVGRKSIYDGKPIEVPDKKPQGDYIKDGRHVTVTKNNYKVWSNFNWKQKTTTKALYQQTFEARGRYEHENGETYYSIYDGKGKWQGYLNAKATTEGKGKQGAYIKDGRYVTITSKNYNTWSNFNWKKRQDAKHLTGNTYQAKGRYNHVNGSTYYSLYDNNGKWQGYINAKSAKVGKGKQGAYMSYGKTVKIKKTGYNTWNNFNWSKRQSTNQLKGRSYVARGQYKHMNGSTYYSLFDNKGKWHGYVNANATK